MRLRRKKKKKDLSSLIYNHKTVALIGFIIISLFSVPLWRKIDEKKRMNTELNSLKSEIQKLSIDNKNLDQLIDYLKSDYFVEEQARLNLGLKKQGEDVFVIKDENDDSLLDEFAIKNTLNLSKKIDSENKTNTSKWIGYFFGS